jgi:hypothetical protein
MNRLSSINLSACSSLTSIGNFAFANCNYLSGAIGLPASLISVSVNAFRNCIGVTAFDINSSNTKYVTLDGIIYSKNQKSLVLCPPGKTGSVVITAQLDSINPSAFNNCSGVSSVTLPSSISVVGDSAFYNTTILDTIICLSTTEPYIGIASFSNGPVKRTLYVPNASSGFTAVRWGASSILYGQLPTNVSVKDDAEIAIYSYQSGIKFKNVADGTSYRIVDIMGRVVNEGKITCSDFNVNLSPQIYLVTLGDNSKIFKIIVRQE